jgi:hypothetical protein
VSTHAEQEVDGASNDRQLAELKKKHDAQRRALQSKFAELNVRTPGSV